MPISTDASWPAGLRRIFDICRQDFQPREKHYNGPYNTLLAYCFGPNLFDFVVSLDPPPLESTPRDTDDFILSLIVFDARCHPARPVPVLIAEIRDDTWVNEASARFEADDQMRRRYNAMAPGCPRLYGLSLLGTSLRVYVRDVATGEIEPGSTIHPGPVHTLPDDFLEGGWDIDIGIHQDEGNCRRYYCRYYSAGESLVITSSKHTDCSLFITQNAPNNRVICSPRLSPKLYIFHLPLVVARASHEDC